MRQGIHPDYRDSTIKCKETDTWEDGKEYPLFKIEISSASHPFFTGKMKFVDSAGRVEKFQKKYNWGKKDAAAAADGDDK
ncbi:UNVERIFIED_CONTAM: hypothetical protein GTU68_053203 [Idotea baltica]|nr:hypothetical protein [Idotea baltica]